MQLLDLALHQPGDRDPGPARDDLGDVLLGDLLVQQRAALGLAALQPRPPLDHDLLQLGDLAVVELGGALEVPVALGCARPLG